MSSQAAATIDLTGLIGQLRHNELRLQLSAMAKQSSKNEELVPIVEIIPSLRAFAASAFSSKESLQLLTEILSRIYKMPVQDIVSLVSEETDGTNKSKQGRMGKRGLAQKRVRGTKTVKLELKTRSPSLSPPPTQTEPSESSIQLTSLQSQDSISISLRSQYSQLPAIAETKVGEPVAAAATEKKTTRQRRRSQATEENDGVSEASTVTEPQPKRRQVAKRQNKQNTLKSVSDLALLFNVTKKHDIGTILQYNPNRIWIGSHIFLSNESFLSLSKLPTWSEFLYTYDLKIYIKALSWVDDRRAATPCHIPSASSSVPLPVRRISQTLPPEQPKNDLDMRAGLASLLSTASEYKGASFSHSVTPKLWADEPSPAFFQFSIAPPAENQKRARSLAHLLVKFMLITDKTALDILATIVPEGPPLIGDRSHKLEQLELSLLYCNAQFMEATLTNSKVILNTALTWASSLTWDFIAQELPENVLNHAALTALLDNIKEQAESRPKQLLVRGSIPSIYLSIPLVRWLSLHTNTSTRHSLSSLQRVLITRMKLSNPIPAAHSLDSDVKLFLFSKRVAMQALLNLHSSSLSTSAITTLMRPSSPSSKYLLPLGLPAVRLEFVDERLDGPLFDPYQRYFLIPVLHPELQFLIAPPRYLEQPAFMEHPEICAPPLSTTRVLPNLELQIDTKSGATKFIADESIAARTCIMDITGCYLPLEEAYRIICHLLNTGISTGQPCEAIQREALRYCSHCLYLETIHVVIDMNCCSSMTVYVVFADSDETANCEIMFSYSLDQVVCRLYSTRSIEAGTLLLLPPKYRWLSKPEAVQAFAGNIDAMRKSLAAGTLRGCDALLSVDISELFVTDAYNPFHGGYSLLTYPGPYLSIIKEIVAVLMSISYKEIGKKEPGSYLLQPDFKQLGLRHPNSDNADDMHKSTQAKITLQRNIELAQKLILMIISASNSINLFCALDHENMSEHQMENINLVQTAIKEKLSGSFIYSSRCYNVISDIKPITGSTSATILKQAMDNRANAVKRIGTEYNHFLLLYRLAFAVQALEDLFSCAMVSNEPFIQVSSQIPIIGFTELLPNEKFSSENEVAKNRVVEAAEATTPTRANTTETATSSTLFAQKKDPRTASQANHEAKTKTSSTKSDHVYPATDTNELTEPESKDSTQSIMPPSDRESTDFVVFSVHPPSAQPSAPALDLHKIKLVSTLDYLLGAQTPEKVTLPAMPPDPSTWCLSDVLGFAFARYTE